jgi:hypothetical protein
MAHPDNFQSAVFSRFHGSAASDRAERAASAAAAVVIEENKAIAAVLTGARVALLKLGAPEACMAPGYDWADILVMLQDMTPKFDAETVRRVEENALEDERNAIREGV